jgi:hypothetical protein
VLATSGSRRDSGAGRTRSTRSAAVPGGATCERLPGYRTGSAMGESSSGTRFQKRDTDEVLRNVVARECPSRALLCPDVPARKEARALAAAETMAVTVTESVTETVSGAVAGAAPGHVDTTPHRDVPGTPLCPKHPPAVRRVPHNGATGHSTGSAMRFGCPGSEGGRRSREQRGHRRLRLPPHDHAARATLGRPGRPRRPGLREARTPKRIRTG